MFWDGQRWIPEAPAAGPRNPSPIKPRRLRDWLATIPLVLLLPALLAPMLPAQAGRAVPSNDVPTLRIRGSVAPGASVKLTGSGFAPAARAAIIWDASQAIGDVKTNQRGTFTTSATIPSKAAAGKHVIAVTYEPVVAGTPPAATLEVALGDPTPAPDPTAPAPNPTTAPPPPPTAAPTSPPDPTAAPTTPPDPTPRPTATPNPTPDPTPPPPTSTRPFPAPVTSATYNVPASIDASGSSDASAELIAFIKGVPNGSVISFPGSGVYRIDKGLLLAGRKNLVLDGNGATLKMRGAGNDEAASAFLLRGSSHIAIRQFTVIGNNPNTTTIFVSGNENAHVLSLSGWYGGGPSSYVEISNVTASHVYGDGAYLEGRNVAPYEPSHDVWIHDNDWSYIGRNAISSIDVTDLLVEANHFDKIGGAAWDIEPNFAPQVVLRNTYRDNRVGSYGHMPQFVAWFVVSYNVENSLLDHLVVAGNDVSGTGSSGFDGSARGLNSKFASPATNVVFKNNTSSRTVAGPGVLYFKNIDGVIVTGNQQPLSSGTLAQFVYCTAIVYP